MTSIHHINSTANRRVFLPSIHPRRTAITDYFRPKRRDVLDPSDPNFLKYKASVTQQAQQAPVQGDLAPTSIFEDDGSKQQPTPAGTPTPTAKSTRRPMARNPSVMAAALDPNPRSRRHWERKMIIREIRNRGELTKAQKIARTERESLNKSHFFKTSIKKLVPLARQIAGKPIEDAIIQMRFSKKRVAKDVKKHLEYARDKAVVERGMGLGTVKPETDQAYEIDEQTDGKNKHQQNKLEQQGIVVEDKKGKRRFVSDTSNIYVDEAWVGRGRYGVDYDHRARGRVNRLRPPETSESLSKFS